MLLKSHLYVMPEHLNVGSWIMGKRPRTKNTLRMCLMIMRLEYSVERYLGLKHPSLGSYGGSMKCCSIPNSRQYVEALAQCTRKTRINHPRFTDLESLCFIQFWDTRIESKI
mmetsp:Transcript_14102/g.16134  ORF Transcript_14102/g.16134 Transcript_14102/m.16134 type:complete len:112 (-) Transcript_14102:172-507(-)